MISVTRSRRGGAVRPSVCLSQAGYHVTTHASPTGTPEISFAMETNLKFRTLGPTETPCNGLNDTGLGKKAKKQRFSTNMSLYLGNDRRHIVTIEGS